MLGFLLNKFYTDWHVVGEFNIIQIGKQICVPSFVCHEHLQKDYFELTLVLGGKGVITADKLRQNVSGGDIFISFPAELHAIYSSEDEPLEYSFFTFVPTNETLKNALNELALSPIRRKNRVFSDNKITTLVKYLINEIENTDEFSNAILEKITYQISVYLIRDLSLSKKASDVSIADKEGGLHSLCSRIMNYIDINVFTINNLTDISKITNYSYGYISTVFKKTTGKTLSDYLQNKKIQAAKQLIKENKLKLCEISELLGYDSYFSFSRIFKKVCGVSPKTYQSSINCADNQPI